GRGRTRGRYHRRAPGRNLREARDPEGGRGDAAAAGGAHAPGHDRGRGGTGWAGRARARRDGRDVSAAHGRTDRRVRGHGGAARQGRRLRDPGQGGGAGRGDPRRLFRGDGAAAASRARAARAVRGALLVWESGHGFSYSTSLGGEDAKPTRGAYLGPPRIAQERRSPHV